MIINRPGERFTYQGVTYVISADNESVWTNENSALVPCLHGKIVEIRTGTDAETGNDEPELYCTFTYPKNPEIIAELNRRCGGVLGVDYGLEEVYMAPDELEIVTYTAAKDRNGFAMFGKSATETFTDPDKYKVIGHVDGHGWDLVINNTTGELVWLKGETWVNEHRVPVSALLGTSA